MTTSTLKSEIYEMFPDHHYFRLKKLNFEVLPIQISSRLPYEPLLNSTHNIDENIHLLVEAIQVTF